MLSNQQNFTHFILIEHKITEQILLDSKQMVSSFWTYLTSGIVQFYRFGVIKTILNQKNKE